MVKYGRNRDVYVIPANIKSPLIAEQPLSELPTVSEMRHTKELFDKSNEALRKLRHRRAVSGLR